MRLYPFYICLHLDYCLEAEEEARQQLLLVEGAREAGDVLESVAVRLRVRAGAAPLPCPPQASVRWGASRDTT